jgi:hypothetical protein
MVNLFIIVSIFGIIPHYTLYYDIDLLIRLIHAILKKRLQTLRNP